MNARDEFSAYYPIIDRIIRSKIGLSADREERLSSALCHAWEIFENLRSTKPRENNDRPSIALFALADAIRVCAVIGAKRGRRLDSLVCEDRRAEDVYSCCNKKALSENEDGQPLVVAPTDDAPEWTIDEVCDQLTPDEAGVAILLSRGLNRSQVAVELDCSRYTVATICNRIEVLLAT